MKETAIYGISTILGRFINFLLVPLYTNIFPPEQYGVVANLYAYIGIFTVIFLYGIDSAFLKFGASDEFPDREKTFSTAFLLLLGSSLTLAVVFAFLSPVIAPVIGVPAGFEYLIGLTVTTLIFDTLAALPFISLRLNNKSRQFVKLKTLNIFINIILNFILILVFKMGIEAVFISNLAASVLVYLALLPETGRQFRFVIDPVLVKRLMAFGLPYLPGGLAAMMIQVVDRPLVEKFAGIKALGVYQANYRLGIIMMLFVSTFQSAWQPFFLQHQNDEDAKSLFSRILTLFSAAGLLIILFFSLFIKEIVTYPIHGKTLIGSGYWEGIPIVPVVLLAYFFYGMAVNFSAAFFIKEKSLPVPVITGIACVVNIGVNIVLIPVMGLMGAALATLASYLFVAAGYYYFSKKMYPLPYEWNKLFLMFIIAGALYGASVYLPAITGFGLLIKVVLFIVFAVSIVAGKIVSLQHIKMFAGGIAGKFSRK